MSNRYALILISFFFFNAVTQNTDAQQNLHTISTEWQTRAERTSYRETARYEETISYSRKLADASAQITYQEFGHSGEGRALPLLIADRDGDHSPAAVKRKGNAVVLIQACIHAGESDGKDAGFELLRDFAIAKTLPHLLDHVTILFIPIYNTDGHERFGPYNRINQNGPTEMGWRATTAYLNLNRDYMKADAPETRAWLKLWNEWGPDLFIDCHVTDGADFRYNVTYQFEQFENVAPQVRNWLAQTMTKVVPATEGAGNLLSTYLEFKDNRDFLQGIQTFISTPRFSTGYTPMRNRPGLLIETHMFKDYGWRVRGTYDLLRFMIEEVNKDPNSLLKAVHEADQATIREGQKYNAQQRVPLLMELTEKTEPFLLKAVRSHTEMSDISGDLRVVFEDQPVDLTVPIYKETRAARSVVPPLYYIIPPQWRSVIETVNAHGLISERTQKPLTLEVETYRFNDAHWAGEPFEGRLMVTAHAVPIRVQRTYPENSLIVPLAQPAARVAIHLLEPEAPDSLLRWGFFNAIFEQKEYGENYVVEKLAREMLAKDNKLKLEFEKRLAEDPQFAASPTARLNFFYERSPYWDQEKNIYPVGRITEKINRLVKEKPKPKIKPK